MARVYHVGYGVGAHEGRPYGGRLCVGMTGGIGEGMGPRIREDNGWGDGDGGDGRMGVMDGWGWVWEYGGRFRRMRCSKFESCFRGLSRIRG